MRIAQFKPLPYSSSVKRRTDVPVKVAKCLLKPINTLMMEQFYTYSEKQQQPFNHLIAVVAVKPIEEPSVIK